MSHYITSLEELKRKWRQELRQEVRQETFLDILPMLFKLAETDPAVNSEIFQHGAKSGLTKSQIEAKRSKWKKARSQKP
jgi:hypothetical protein